MKVITEEWLDKAEEDFKVSALKENWDNKFYNTICFHSQQCVEKYLKAVLGEEDIEFEKTHDLELLLNKCKQKVPELSGERDNLIWLTQFSVEVRYPGFRASKSNSQKALQIAKKARHLLRRHLGLKT